MGCIFFGSRTGFNCNICKKDIAICKCNLCSICNKSIENCKNIHRFNSKKINISTSICKNCYHKKCICNLCNDCNNPITYCKCQYLDVSDNCSICDYTKSECECQQINEMIQFQNLIAPLLEISTKKYK